MTKEQLAAQAAEIARLTAERDKYARMSNAACIDLGLINESLDLDPDDGGAGPIVEAIATLKQDAARLAPVIAAALEWSSERAPSDHAEGELMKAIATMEGDWPGCEECDHECDEPCIPATVVEIHASIDACLAKQAAKKTEEGRKQWRAIEAVTQPAEAPKPITGPCGQCKSSATPCYCLAAAIHAQR